jgi:hypothetical protein
MATRNRDDDDDDDDRPRKKKPRPSEEIEDDDRPLKKRRPTDDEDGDDDDDDRPRRRSVRRSAPNDGGVGVVIPYRNSMALMAYYLGIFGLIPCVIGLGFLGIVPVVMGIMGLKRSCLDRHRAGSRGDHDRVRRRWIFSLRLRHCITTPPMKMLTGPWAACAAASSRTAEKEMDESGWTPFLFAVFSILFLFRTVRGRLRFGSPGKSPCSICRPCGT